MNELKVRVHNIYLPMIGLSEKALEKGLGFLQIYKGTKDEGETAWGGGGGAPLIGITEK
jgi:hypothetical protein